MNKKTQNEIRIALLGTVGVPSCYGGFETLAENLVHYHSSNICDASLTVWCSRKDNIKHPNCFKSAKLRYVNLRANGIQSILYDALSLFQAIMTGHNRILLLGTSGALTIPIIRLISRVRIITNVDGIEWKREKWRGLARIVLRSSEWAAVRFSHEVIADNTAIALYLRDSYGINCQVIEYGGDHTLASDKQSEAPEGLPNSYALALCRIEPENNVQMILEAWKKFDIPLVFVGNWNHSSYSKKIRELFSREPNLYLIDQVYNPRTLKALRNNAMFYVHGHSAGGTNPSLVEMMHFGVPIFAHGCVFNRHSTEGKARYFLTSDELYHSINTITPNEAESIAANMLEIAQRRYVWSKIGKAYFALF
jgi:glycosyltransferase involved in cell wall biosynthesis